MVINFKALNGTVSARCEPMLFVNGTQRTRCYIRHVDSIRLQMAQLVPTIFMRHALYCNYLKADCRRQQPYYMYTPSYFSVW